MYNYAYVTAEELSPVKKELISIIHSVQELLRGEFTFQFEFTGSAERNMVTHDVKSNIGFDFDVNIRINAGKCRFSAEEIKRKIKNALDKTAPRFGYDYAEDSTRVLTIKFKDRKNCRIVHSCDIAIVCGYIDEHGNAGQKYIHFNKKQNAYSWKKQPGGRYLLQEKADWIKDNGYEDKMRKLYLYKKNSNTNPDKSSESIYAETIHEICQKHGFFKMSRKGR